MPLLGVWLWLAEEEYIADLKRKRRKVGGLRLIDVCSLIGDVVLCIYVCAVHSFEDARN